MGTVVPLYAALLHTQRWGIRAALENIEALPDSERAHLRAGLMQALGAIEDTLRIDRTYPPKADRMAARRTALEAPALRPWGT